MAKVHEFAAAPAIYDDTKIPSGRLRDIDAPGNFNITLLQLKNYLITAGFVQAAVITPADEVSVEDSAGNFTGTNVEAVLAELFALIPGGPVTGGAAIPSLKTFSIDGMSISVTYFGTTEPTLTGSAGSYDLTFQTGTVPKSAFFFAIDGSVPTGIGTFSLLVNGDRNFNSVVQFTDLDDGTRFQPGQRSVTAKETSSATRATNTFVGLSTATTGFSIQFIF